MGTVFQGRSCLKNSCTVNGFSILFDPPNQLEDPWLLDLLTVVVSLGKGARISVVLFQAFFVVRVALFQAFDVV